MIDSKTYYNKKTNQYYAYFEDEESGKEVIYTDDKENKIPVRYLGSIGDDFDVMRVIELNGEKKLVYFLTLSNGKISTRW